MSAFKEMVASDMDQVIFNTDEMADLHEFDGMQLPVIIDDAYLHEMHSPPKYADGYNTAARLIFIRAKDLPGKPAVGSMVRFDGETYIVGSVNGKDVWEITLEANR